LRFLKLNNWGQPHMVILFIFLFTTFSGVVRKWILPLGIVNNLVLFFQLLLPLIFVFLPFNKSKSTLLSIMPIYLLVLILMAFNPLNQSIYHGLLGIILHFGFWYVLSYYLNNRENFKVEKLIPVFVIISIAQIVFAAIQYGLPTDHFLNSYVAETDAVATVGDSVRVSGTFSYIGGFGAYMIFYTFLMLTIIKIGYAKKNIIFLIALGFFGCFMSGGRSIIVFYSVCLLLSLSKNFILILLKGLIGWLPVFFIVAILGVGGGIISLVNKSSDNFFERVDNTRESGEQSRRVSGALNDVIDFKGDYQVFGRGLGGTYQGANAIWGESPFITAYGGYEEEPERIILEGGFCLLFIKLLLWCLFFIDSKINKTLLIVIILIVLVYFIYTFNIFNGIYLLLGLILLDRINFIDENNSFTPRHTAR
jgi:hypothetical protein